MYICMYVCTYVCMYYVNMILCMNGRLGLHLTCRAVMGSKVVDSMDKSSS